MSATAIRGGRTSWAVGLAALGLIAATTRGDEPLAPGWFAGRVVGPDGRAVAGARVWSESVTFRARGLPPVVEARSDAEGRFRLGPLPASNYYRANLNAAADGFAATSARRDRLAIYPEQDHDLGTIRLDRGRVFSGQVLDIGDKPRAGATVEVGVRYNTLGHTVSALIPDIKLTTDVDGRFRTPPLPVGHLSLLIQVPERQLAGVHKPIDPGGAEDVGGIALQPDFPVTGTVVDDEGNPLADARIGGTVGHSSTTDAAGKFVLRGFGPNPSFQLNVDKPGYEGTVGRVTVTAAGIAYNIRGAGAVPVPELVVTLERVAAIEGRAVDAETGAAVPLRQVAVRQIVRTDAGEIASLGRAATFPQTEPGRFRADYPGGNEYRLTFSAPGYADAVVDLPRAVEPPAGVVARLKRQAAGPATPPARQAVVGTVTRDGRPVAAGWVSVLGVPRTTNPINAPVQHGRMVVDAAPVLDGGVIRAGAYRLDLPFPRGDFYLLVDEPGRPLARVGPITVAAGETKSNDIACPAGGAIRGRVAEVPEGWEGHGWVVAFSHAGVRAEVRVEPDGTFALPALPPDEYGLKVGHDAHEDPEVYPGINVRLHPEAFGQVADPWKQARVVKVEAGRDADGVELEWPE